MNYGESLMNGSYSQGSLLKKIRRTIQEHRMIHSGTSVVVGVSGGPDSTALLHLLTRLRNDLDFRVVAAHLDHGLRAESATDAEFVSETAATLGVKVYIKTVDVRSLARGYGVSVEEAGRRARYEFFEVLRSSLGAAVIATAHHREDQIETFFLRVFRGSSLNGLKGILPVRGGIVRPLIDASRAEILRFLDDEKIPYRVDRTNLGSDTDRNYIRNRIVPMVEGRFPDFSEPLRRTIELIAVEDRFLNEQARNLYSRVVSRSADSLVLEVRELLAAPEVLAARVILEAFITLSGPHTRWSREHVREVMKVMRGRKPSAKVDLTGGLVLRREYERLFLSIKREEEYCPPFSTTVSGPGEVRITGSGSVIVFRTFSGTPDFRADFADPRVAYFDADQIQFPLILRSLHPGDRFRPWGTGGARKLKKVLIDSKVPVRVRRKIPLLVKGNEILWIPGVRRSASAPVLRDTSLILEARLVEGPTF
jgi:tRNA(Ile)-lysidine synthase